jgi:hypothetical protein
MENSSSNTRCGEGTAVSHFLTRRELALRWRLTERTLDRWREQGAGPDALRIGGRILYPWEDVLAYEAARLRRPAD